MAFINFSNHSSANWSEEQKAAAMEYGEIIDLQFPAVDPKADTAEIEKLADACVNKIMQSEPAAVMCQGEFTLTYQIVKKLEQKGVPTLSACSERNVRLVTDEDGTVKKVINFDFERFRGYY